MKLKVNNKIPQMTKVKFGSLMNGEIFIDEVGDLCMVVGEACLSNPDRHNLVNCVVLSGPSIGTVVVMDDDDIVTIVKAELNILNYE